MKFSVALSSLILLLPLLTEASPLGSSLQARRGGRDRGGKGGDNNAKGGADNAKGGNQNGGGGDAATSTTDAAAASSTTAAAAAASSSVAATGQAQDPTDNTADAQTSLTLDPSQVMKGIQQDGQAVQEAGQVASLTSTNNFINFCLTQPNLPLTNGQQVIDGSCNPVPMGVILAQKNMPSAKFVFPTNGANVDANKPFTVQLAVANMETGNFVNAQSNYFGAPQQINSAGQLVAHSHIVIESIPSLTSTAVTDPTKFAFFKGLNAAAVNGVLTADVTNGLPAGTYRIASINTAANHQPALVAVAQHGTLDDMTYVS
ncbi:hypothetical protein SISSUDRAFT_979572 [Sistotremastrum suecicum HHB10207 ss-3]|uniref:CHRD domain-containing protein n=1 Tax=Sistotremastrum suecicum HHB10207 ss-3 TaxID=1314776 RepID=A0A166HLA8_9AGAM|nr:hypothetical protein SISSUDRAFT_979572 [Sistotremastrum suecicum HHB10207 ss-3]